MIKPLFLLLALVTASSAFADDIEVPEEELARETTLPVFDKRRVVLNRNVITEKRFEFGAGVGLEVNEPFYSDYMLNLQATYNYDDTSALNVQALMWMDGLSTYGEQLLAGQCPTDGGKFCPFDASLAPHPKFALMANYQFTAYYGKISLSKQGVMNLNLFGLAGLGYLNLGDVNTVAMNLGLGQNFFFTNNFGLRFDIRWLIYQGPNPPTADVSPGLNPSPSDFGNRIFYNTQLGVTAVVIL